MVVNETSSIWRIARRLMPRDRTKLVVSLAFGALILMPPGTCASAGGRSSRRR
jgi:hypothetical protein